MSPDSIFAVVAVGAFLLLCVVSWYLVLLLRQMRLTALALEEFLTRTRPQVEGATEQLRSLLARVDRFFVAAEEGRGAAGNVLGTIAQALSGWAAGRHAVATTSAILAAVTQAWSMISRAGAAPDPQAPPEGAGRA